MLPVFVIFGGIVIVMAIIAHSGVSPVVGRVSGLDRAKGVHPELIQLLQAWNISGEFDVQVSPSGGGLRKSLQDTEFGSNATNLAETPHGRGGALDVWPIGFDPYKTLMSQPYVMEQMRIFGHFAKAKGFVWGGDWQNFKVTDAQKRGIDPPGDWPHIEMKNWRSLPFPPPEY